MGALGRQTSFTFVHVRVSPAWIPACFRAFLRNGLALPLLVVHTVGGGQSMLCCG